MLLSRFQVLLTMVTLLGLPAAAVAQPPKTEPIDEKMLAKAAFEASLKKPEELAKAKLAAAEQLVEARYKEFVAGKITMVFLFDAHALLMDAQTAIPATKAEREAQLTRNCEFAIAVEQISRSKYEAGATPVSEYTLALYQRLHAEWLLAKFREK